MTPFLEELASRRRFGIKPGLETIAEVCRRLGDPQTAFRAVHVAGTNGKGAVCAMLDACLGEGRYTSPHLVNLNERFFLRGAPIDDATLERAAARVAAAAPQELTFFEALTAIAFLVYAEANVARAVLECGLGGRLDATNVCRPELCVITRIGLDHCDWLGDTVEKIAVEKAGIVKSGVPVVLGRNEPAVVGTIRRIAAERGAPFRYAPDLASETEIPKGFPLGGAFNRENAVTALAALKVLGVASDNLVRTVWPGRFQRIGEFIVDGAHNPPAATALAASLTRNDGNLIAGFCGDKDVDAVLATLAPRFRRGYAVKTNNPRSLPAEATAEKMRRAGIPAEACASLDEALAKCRGVPTVICGSLFLAGEALVALGGWRLSAPARFDPSERL